MATRSKLKKEEIGLNSPKVYSKLRSTISNFSDEEEKVLLKSLEKLNTFFEIKYKSFQ